jgi:hypothetical protein
MSLRLSPRFWLPVRSKGFHAAYPTRYRDALGELETVLENDGNELSIVVRGIEFRGSDFESLAASDIDPSTKVLFSLEEGFYVDRKGETLPEEYHILTDFIIDFEMPIALFVAGAVKDATLQLHLERGTTPSRPEWGERGYDCTFLSLTLLIGQNRLASNESTGNFEGQLLDLQKQLPEGMYIKACINCAFSDYSPGGCDDFGDLACFRDNKQAYLSVKGKRDLFQIWPTRTEFVQETYLCPEFQRRVPGSGYRG